MAKLAILFLLLTIPITIIRASDAPLAPPSNSFLTPYAAVPSGESPSPDTVADSDAASIGAPASEYLPAIDGESKFKSAASFLGASFVGGAAATIAGAVGYLLV